MATTQFEATDARQAFPCWDEPEYKATFGVTLVVDADHLAVSNAAEISDEPTDDGRRRVTFADTMVMSTYLVAFVVGPLEATAPVDVDGVPVRVVHGPGQTHLTHFALEVGAFALRYFTDYYGIPYPGDKLDLVADPRLRLRCHGEPGLYHLPRGAPAGRPRVGHQGRAAATSPTSSTTSWPTCGSATWSP